ncbi:MAG: ACP S-malonyltransferase [Candidatus Babeliales bacterium]|nr:ACP S-malonyltransferase [Candidatus Babeliales bacterium]
MKIGILFPGYRSHFVGMGKELYDESRIMQEYFEEAANCLSVNFVKLCFASSDAELGKMQNAYPATFLVSCAIYALLKEEGIKADIVAGYNLGEYAALHAAGGISFPDGLYLLSKYANFYEEALPALDVGILHIKGISTHTLEDACRQASEGQYSAHIALYNSLTDHIVSGNTQALEVVRGIIAADPDTSIKELSVAVGLHSPLMNQVMENQAIYLEKVDFKDLRIPLICSAQSCIVENAEQVRKRIIEHINTPINWAKVVDALSPYDLVIEVGPGSTLTAMVKEKYPDKLCISINKKSDIIDLKKMIEDAQPTIAGDSNGTL